MVEIIAKDYKCKKCGHTQDVPVKVDMRWFEDDPNQSYEVY
tara:strand:+ start:1117 stop:1239 length:123 start_codon:yes stop_codon:yes gene_type:complete